jgi:hypothetical protein
MDRRRLHWRPAHEIKAEVSDIGSPLLVDHHVVEVVVDLAAQVRVRDKGAIVLAAQELSVAHRYDQQATVRKPTQARRLVGNHGLDPDIGTVLVG